jgi:multidrug efflux pump subunit AcrA (membrane-fusion protein)
VLIAALFLVGSIGIMGAATDMSGAIISQGSLVVESSIKKVQHPTGGVAKALLIENGARVAKDDLLIRMDETVAQAQIPAEDAAVLDDATVLVWSTDTEDDGADIQADKVLGPLTAVKDGRSVYTGDMLASAIYFSSILSLPYVIDHLVPKLEKVFPGA